MNVCVALQDAEGEDLYDAEGVLLYDGDDCTESIGAPVQGLWSARIRGKTIYGTKEAIRESLIKAATEDAKQQAEDVVRDATSNRQIRKAARERANSAREAVRKEIQPPIDIFRIQKKPDDYAAQAAEINRLYLKAFEDALVARALEIAAENREDVDDLNELEELDELMEIA